MAENAGNTEASGLTAKMASSPASEKKHRSNDGASPAHQAANHSSPVAGKQTESLIPPAVTEKKPQTNGQASPVRLPANNSNGHAGLEGFLKTDDRMRLAKERREERERSLAAREQAIREKERRAQLQYERTVEERWKRLEEQRLKEEQRRAAVEEKRRQQLEEEKERLEALMRRSLERSLQLESRNKRWMWGGTGPGQGDWENAPPLSAASALPYDLAAPSPAVSESGNVTSSPHRSPYRGSPSRRRGNAAFTEDLGRGSSTAPSTPKKGSLRRERGAASPATGSPVRRADDVIRRSASPSTPKLTPKRRNQSPVTTRQYPVSPLRHKPTTPVVDTNNKGPEDKVTNDKQATKVRGHDPSDAKPHPAEEASKKNPDMAGKTHSPVHKDSRPGTPERGGRKTENPRATGQAGPGQRDPDPDNREEQNPKTGTTHNRSNNNLTTNKSTDKSPVTPSQKGEEASRLQVERHRLAYAQRQQDEQERLKVELRKRQVDGRSREEEETRREEDDFRARKREEEEEMQSQLEKEREIAGRQRQGRELMQQQEEQERQQRKKRIEEIMKRTRKSDGELKREDSQEPQSLSPLSPPGEVPVDSKSDSDAKVPPRGVQPGSAPGSPAPPTGIQSGSAPGSPAPPRGVQPGSAPGSPAPPTVVQPGSSVDSWVKPQAPGIPVRQNSTEKRLQSFGGSERAHAPAQVLLRSPSPNGQARSAKTLDQKGEKEQERPQSSSAPRNDGSPAKEQTSQPRATAQLPEGDSAPAKSPAQVPMRNPQLQANSTPVVPQGQKAEVQVKNLMCEQATILHEAWAITKSAVKMPDSPQLNGKGHQVNSQTCAAQVKTQAQPNGQTSSQATSKVVVKERSPASLPPLTVSQTPPPLISLDCLEGRGGAREEKLTDEVQLMEISPVPKEELISIPQFSPVADVRPSSMSKTRALEDLLDLTGQVAYPKIPPCAALGDCNKNLIEGVCSPSSETKVIANNPPAPNKLNIQ